MTIINPFTIEHLLFEGDNLFQAQFVLTSNTVGSREKSRVLCSALKFNITKSPALLSRSLRQKRHKTTGYY